MPNNPYLSVPSYECDKNSHRMCYASEGHTIEGHTIEGSWFPASEVAFLNVGPRTWYAVHPATEVSPDFLLIIPLGVPFRIVRASDNPQQ